MRALDGVRGLAILGVLGVHARGILPGGHLGVAIFFVLSGYLITSGLSEPLRRGERDVFRRFYARRFLKIMPALSVVLAFALVANLVIVGQPAKSFLPEFMGSLLSFGDFAEAYGTHQWIQLGWTWSLSMEEQFYALWPLLLLCALRLARSRPRLVLILPITVVLASSGARVWSAFGQHPNVHALYVSPLFRFDGLALGCLVALAPIEWRRTFARAAWGWIAIGVIALGYVASGITSRDHFVIWLPCVELSTALILAHVSSHGEEPFDSAPKMRHGLFYRLCESRLLAGLGRISYGVYLWNLPIYFALSGLCHAAGLRNIHGLVLLPLGASWLILNLLAARLSLIFLEGASSRVGRALTAPGRRIGRLVAA